VPCAPRALRPARPRGLQIEPEPGCGSPWRDWPPARRRHPKLSDAPSLIWQRLGTSTDRIRRWAIRAPR